MYAWLDAVSRDEGCEQGFPRIRFLSEYGHALSQMLLIVLADDEGFRCEFCLAQIYIIVCTLYEQVYLLLSAVLRHEQTLVITPAMPSWRMICSTWTIATISKVRPCHTATARLSAISGQ